MISLKLDASKIRKGIEKAKEEKYLKEIENLDFLYKKVNFYSLNDNEELQKRIFHHIYTQYIFSRPRHEIISIAYEDAKKNIHVRILYRHECANHFECFCTINEKRLGNEGKISEEFWNSLRNSSNYDFSGEIPNIEFSYFEVRNIEDAI